MERWNEGRDERKEGSEDVTANEGRDERKEGSEDVTAMQVDGKV